jgi:chromosome segregation ATPase
MVSHSLDMRRGETVCAEQSKSASEVAPLRDALGDLSGIHDEYARFFGDTFDQLEALSLELFARHKCLELSVQQQTKSEAAGAEIEGQLHECLEELRDLKERVCSANVDSGNLDKMWSEISANHKQLSQEHAELHETQEKLVRLSADFRAMRESVDQERAESQRRQENIEEHLKRMAATLAESAAAQPLGGSDEQLTHVIEAARQQQAAWQQDRATLEAELESERQRSAQQNEALTEQRRLAAEQQGVLAGELKRMRSLMEILMNHLNQPGGGNNGNGKESSSSPENAALESMLAQFEMLQRDLAQRRAGSAKDTVKR